jgi:hypothetical protein
VVLVAVEVLGTQAHLPQLILEMVGEALQQIKLLLQTLLLTDLLAETAGKATQAGEVVAQAALAVTVVAVTTATQVLLAVLAVTEVLVVHLQLQALQYFMQVAVEVLHRALALVLVVLVVAVMERALTLQIKKNYAELTA